MYLIGPPDALAGVALRRLGVRVLAAMLVGGAAVFVYLNVFWNDPWSPNPGDVEQILGYSFSVGLAALAAVIGLRWLGRYRVRLAGWLGGVRDDNQGELLARMSRSGVALIAGCWAGAAVLTAGQLVVRDPAAALRILAGSALGGATATLLAAELIDAALRPLRVFTLERPGPAGVQTTGIRRRLVVSWALGSALPLVALGLAPVWGGLRFDLSVVVWFSVGFALLAGAGAATLASRAVAGPVEDVATAMHAVREGRLTTSVAVDEVGELGLLQATFNEMTAAAA